MADPLAIFVLSVIAISIFFGFCCHFVSQKRKDAERATLQTAVGTSGFAHPRTSGTENWNTRPAFITGLQGAGLNSNVRAREAESNPVEDQPNENPPDGSLLSPDPIADSGPPPYSCLSLSGEPLSPPPSYEAALRASTEQLAIARQGHIV
ncbi:hypothetical protein ACROYT_G034210 [Oculina patagonica]